MISKRLFLVGGLLALLIVASGSALYFYGRPSADSGAGLFVVASVMSNSTQAVVLINAGTVWTWGDNYYGQLGDGTTINRSTPVQVLLPVSAKAIAVGNHSVFAIGTDGTVWAWGYNLYKQLCDVPTPNLSSQVQFPCLSGFAQIF